MKYYLFKNQKLNFGNRMALLAVMLILMCVDIILLILGLKNPFQFVFLGMVVLFTIGIITEFFRKSDHGVFLAENQLEFDESHSNHFKTFSRIPYIDIYDSVISYDMIKCVEITTENKNCRWIGGKRKKGQEYIILTVLTDRRFDVTAEYGFIVENQDEFINDLKQRIDLTE